MASSPRRSVVVFQGFDSVPERGGNLSHSCLSALDIAVVAPGVPLRAIVLAVRA